VENLARKVLVGRNKPCVECGGMTSVLKAVRPWLDAVQVKSEIGLESFAFVAFEEGIS
jgi:hypothetical protein